MYLHNGLIEKDPKYQMKLQNKVSKVSGKLRKKGLLEFWGMLRGIFLEIIVKIYCLLDWWKG